MTAYEMTPADWAAMFGPTTKPAVPTPQAAPAPPPPPAPIPVVQAPASLDTTLRIPCETISADGGARVTQAVAKLNGADEPPKVAVRTADEILAAQRGKTDEDVQPLSTTPTAVSPELAEIRAMRVDLRDLTSLVLSIVNRKGGTR